MNSSSLSHWVWAGWTEILFAWSLGLPLAGALSAGHPARADSVTNAQVLRLPLHNRAAWRLSNYDQIPVHDLDFSAAGLQFSVKRSAMPVLFPLSRPLRLRSIRAKGQITGKLNVTSERQGSKGHDDYALRVGLVEAGGKSLSPRQSRSAPAWVQALSELVPPGQGVARVHFLAVGLEPAQIGRTRRHPQSELIEEEVVAAPGPDGQFDFVRIFPQPQETCGVWLAVDGDDTGSVFQTTLTEIEVEYVRP